MVRQLLNHRAGQRRGSGPNAVTGLGQRYVTWAMVTAMAFSSIIQCPAVARAEDDVVVIPGRFNSATIAAQELLANDGAAASILSHTPASRGALSFLSGVFTYAPNATFFDTGMDSFRYDSDYTVNQGHTVHLVAGLDRLNIASDAAQIGGRSCTLGPEWEFTGSGQGAAVVPDGAGGCALEFDLAHSQLQPQVKALNARRGGPGGGHTVIVLDPGGDPPPPPPGNSSNGPGLSRVTAGNPSGTPTNGSPLHHLVATATAVSEGQNPVVVFALRLVGRDMVGLARQNDGSYVQTSSVTLADGINEVGFSWWFEGHRGLRDGGLFLQIDGRLVTQRLEIQNSNFLGHELRWSFGLNGFPSGGTGALRLWRPEVWVSARQAHFPPHLSDHGYASPEVVWSRLSQADGVHTVTQPASSDPERHLKAPTTRFGNLLIDETVRGLQRYNLQMELGLELLSIANGSTWTLFRGYLEPTAGPSELNAGAIRVVVHRDLNGKFHLQGSSSDGAYLRSTEWIPIPPPPARSTVRLSWRGATGSNSPDGVLLVSVNSTREVLSGLSSAGLQLRRSEVGFCETRGSVLGTLILDALESWR